MDFQFFTSVGEGTAVCLRDYKHVSDEHDEGDRHEVARVYELIRFVAQKGYCEEKEKQPL